LMHTVVVATEKKEGKCAECARLRTLMHGHAQGARFILCFEFQ